MIPFHEPSRPRNARAFTLVEMIVAVTITSFVLGVLWMSVGNLSKARNTSRARMLAHLRADAALGAIRRDVASVLRSDDLFWTMLRVKNGSAVRNGMAVDRDDILVFCSRMSALRPQLGISEGIEYETQYRIQDDEAGSTLWQRRDAVPDEYYDGGGIATPIVENIIGLNIEVWDGYEWWNTWNSDDYGLPLAVRISVVAPIEGKPGEKPVILSTLVSIGRVPPPFDADEDEEDEEEQQQTPPGGETSPDEDETLPDEDDAGVGTGGRNIGNSGRSGGSGGSRNTGGDR